MRNRRSGAALVSITFLLLSQTGCSVYLAVEQPDKKDLSVFEPTRPRTLLMREIGDPEHTQVVSGRTIDYFEFTQGYSSGARYGRAAFHAVPKPSNSIPVTGSEPQP